MMFALNMIAEQLNLAEITWALGGSNVLKKYGIVEDVSDIDIFVMEKDIERASKILAQLGTKLATTPTKKFETTYFYQYNIHHTQVDLICDFKIKYQDIVYTYVFDDQSIVDYDQIAGTNIYYTSLEDWYILYHLMERDDNEKIVNLEKHFMLHGIQNKFLLLRALDKVPKNLKFMINYQLGL